MVDLDTYEFKDLNTLKIAPEESFMNAYSKEVNELEHFLTSNQQSHEILDYKYENAVLNRVTQNECQNLTEVQRNELIKLLQKL